MAKAKEAAAEAKDKEASGKLAGLLAREQAVADYKEQHAAALQATQAADQVSIETLRQQDCGFESRVIGLVGWQKLVTLSLSSCGSFCCA